jgi:hypothetical protein
VCKGSVDLIPMVSEVNLLCEMNISRFILLYYISFDSIRFVSIRLVRPITSLRFLFRNRCINSGSSTCRPRPCKRARHLRSASVDPHQSIRCFHCFNSRQSNRCNLFDGPCCYHGAKGQETLRQAVWNPGTINVHRAAVASVIRKSRN